MPRFENTIKQLKNLAPSLQFFALSQEEEAEACSLAEKALRNTPIESGAENLRSRKEFLLGRYCLSEAIRQIPEFTGESWYGPSPVSRRPPCPSELLVSLSHCKGACLAAAGMKSDEFRGFGVDIEELYRPVRNGFFERITSEEERASQLAILEKNGALVSLPNQIAVTTFSAKEAAFKALPDGLQSRLTISKISISFLDWQNHSISYQAKIKSTEQKYSIHGICVFDSNFLFTLALFV